MAMACLGLVTFLPLRPDLSWPFFISFISVSTFLPAEGEYFRPEDFFFDDDFRELEDDFLDEDFLAPLLRLLVLRRLLLFFALPPREDFLDELLFFALLDLFFAAFLVAMLILLDNQMFSPIPSVVSEMREHVRAEPPCASRRLCR
jgi:hypothetical protein